MKWMYIIGLLALGASCKDKPAIPPAPDAAPDVIRADVGAAADVAKPPDAVTWKVEVEGKPVISGDLVKRTEVGPVTKFNMYGAPASVLIETDEGVEDPRIVNIGFNQAKQGCFYRAEDRQLSSGLTVTFDGRRGEIEGEVTCHPLDDTAPEKSKAKITGWFEIEPKKERKRVAAKEEPSAPQPDTGTTD